jgi:hypothetical protein
MPTLFIPVHNTPTSTIPSTNFVFSCHHVPSPTTASPSPGTDYISGFILLSRPGQHGQHIPSKRAPSGHVYAVNYAADCCLTTPSSDIIYISLTRSPTNINATRYVFITMVGISMTHSPCFACSSCICDTIFIIFDSFTQEHTVLDSQTRQFS